MWILPFLFLALQPGFLVTIPPGSKGLFFSGETSIQAVVVHTLLFAGICIALNYFAPQILLGTKAVEGFKNESGIPGDPIRSCSVDADCARNTARKRCRNNRCSRY